MILYIVCATQFKEIVKILGITGNNFTWVDDYSNVRLFLDRSEAVEAARKYRMSGCLSEVFPLLTLKSTYYT